MTMNNINEKKKTKPNLKRGTRTHVLRTLCSSRYVFLKRVALSTAFSWEATLVARSRSGTRAGRASAGSSEGLVFLEPSGPERGSG